MSASEQQAQPSPGSGLVRVSNGVWYEAAIRKLDKLGAGGLVWIASHDRFSHVATLNGKPVAKIHRTLREQPWLVRVERFRFWAPPGRVIKHWHYTQPLAVNDLRAAKRLVSDVIADRHNISA